MLALAQCELEAVRKDAETPEIVTHAARPSQATPPGLRTKLIQFASDSEAVRQSVSAAHFLSLSVLSGLAKD